MSNARKILILIPPGSCDAAYLLQWTCSNFFHRPQDTLFLVTGPALLIQGRVHSENYQDDLDKVITDFREREATIGRNIPDDLTFNKTVLNSNTESKDMNQALQEFVKNVHPDILVIDGHDLEELKKAGVWQGSFSKFCVNQLKTHVIVVRHPSDDTHHHHNPH